MLPHVYAIYGVIRPQWVNIFSGQFVNISHINNMAIKSYLVPLYCCYIVETKHTNFGTIVV